MKSLFFAILIILGGTTAASAEEMKIYVGGGLGNASVNGTDNVSTSSNVSFNLMAGLEINPNFSFELAFLNLGSVTNSGSSASTLGMSGTVVGLLPLPDNFDLFAKFGLAGLQTGWPAPLESESKTSLTGGAGIQLDFSPRASARLTYDRYQFGVDSTTTGNFDVVTLGLIYRLSQ